MRSLSKVTEVGHINWNGFEALGDGTFGTVFCKTSSTRTRYAIKVGRIARTEVDGLRRAHEKGLAVPIYTFFQRVAVGRLPGHIYDALDGEHIHSDDTVDILIMGRATPINKHRNARRRGFVRRNRDKLEDRAWQEGIYWPDSHSGNVGIYRGKAVILDGINFGWSDFSDRHNSYYSSY